VAFLLAVVDLAGNSFCQFQFLSAALEILQLRELNLRVGQSLVDLQSQLGKPRPDKASGQLISCCKLTEPVCCHLCGSCKRYTSSTDLANMLKGSFRLGRISLRQHVENGLNRRSMKLAVHLHLALGLI
jgi:hypothetical protein